MVAGVGVLAFVAGIKVSGQSHHIAKRMKPKHKCRLKQLDGHT